MTNVFYLSRLKLFVEDKFTLTQMMEYVLKGYQTLHGKKKNRHSGREP